MLQASLNEECHPAAATRLREAVANNTTGVDTRLYNTCDVEIDFDRGTATIAEFMAAVEAHMATLPARRRRRWWRRSRTS